MSWVEELKPDDDVKVEIIFPKEYVEHSIATMKNHASGISLICKGYATLGDDETEFLVYDMTIMQVISLEEIMKQFGVILTHESGKFSNGERWTYFYADLRGLKEKLENGELEKDN